MAEHTISRARARRILTFSIDVALQMFRNGMETAGIARTVRSLAATAGLNRTQVTLGARTIQVQHRRPSDEDPIVLLGGVDADDSRDIGRMADLERLAYEAATGRAPLEEAEQRVEELSAAPPTWPRSVSVLGGCALAAMICLQANGTVVAALLAAALFALANRVGWALSIVGIAGFFQVAAKAAVVLLAGIGLLALGWVSAAEAASLAAANIVLLLPILSLVSLVEDAVGGFHLMAAARAVLVLLLTGAIATGLMVVTALARDLDILGEASRVELAALPLWLVPLTAVVGSLGNALLMGTPARWWGVAGGAGVVTSLANWAGLHLLGLSGPLAILLATTVLGIMAGVAVRRFGVPSAAVAIPGLTGAVLPGPAMYTSLSHVFARLPGAWDAVAETVVSTAAIGVGVVLGLQLVALRRSAGSDNGLR